MYIHAQAALREQPPAVMLVGNKTDQQAERVVSSEDGRLLALVGHIAYICNPPV